MKESFLSDRNNLVPQKLTLRVTITLNLVRNLANL